MTGQPHRTVLAIDPGRSKCGVAVCEPGRVLSRAVIPLDSLPVYVAACRATHDIAEVVIGNRTGATQVERLLAATGAGPLRLVDEAGTTLRARERYFKDHPPKGWRRLVPRGLLTPSEPYDDYAAVLLAEAALAGEGQKESRDPRRRE
jgi:RNase H-fold protein (predicted Holliday junction resolvase)